MQRRMPPPKGIHENVSGALVQEALGRNSLGSLVHAGVAVGQVDATAPPRARRQQRARPRAAPRCSTRTTIGTTGRTRSVSLTTACHVLLALARVDLRHQPRELVGMAHQPLDRPGHRGRGRLVAGQQQRHELVAQLAVGHRLPVLVARLQQQREDVRALAPGRLLAPARDLLVDQRVEPVAAPAPIAAVGARHASAGAARPSAAPACSSAPAAARSPRAAAPMRSASTPNTARRITSSVIARVRALQPHRPPERPAGHVAPRRLARSPLRTRACARRGTAAAAACAGACARARSDDHRARPHHRRDRRVAAADGRHLGRRREDRP